MTFQHPPWTKHIRQSTEDLYVSATVLLTALQWILK